MISSGTVAAAAAAAAPAAGVAAVAAARWLKGFSFVQIVRLSAAADIAAPGLTLLREKFLDLDGKCCGPRPTFVDLLNGLSDESFSHNLSLAESASSAHLMSADNMLEFGVRVRRETRRTLHTLRLYSPRFLYP